MQWVTLVNKKRFMSDFKIATSLEVSQSLNDSTVMYMCTNILKCTLLYHIPALSISAFMASTKQTKIFSTDLQI